MNPFCTCLLQQLEFNAVAELLFHTGGVNGIKIQVWRAGRFVFGFDTHGIHPQHWKHAIYFTVSEGKQLSSALKWLADSMNLVDL